MNINSKSTEIKKIGVTLNIPHGVDELKKSIIHFTDMNHHTEAILEIAKYLHDYNIISILNHINAIHMLDGGMPTNLSRYRDDVYNQLKEKFIKEYGEEVWKDIVRAF